MTLLSPDIDECSLQVNSCVENANCMNNGGSYTCECASGYSGDGFRNCVSNEQNNTAIFVGIGVIITGLFLIATAVIIVIVFSYLMRKNKLNITQYLSSSRSSSLELNAAYIATCDQGPTIYTETNLAYTLFNEAYGVATASNERGGITTLTNVAHVATDIPTSSNQAYQRTK